MMREQKAKVFLAVLSVLISRQVVAAECRNRWAAPSTQTMNTDGAVSYRLTEFRNGERRFQAKQGQDQSVDIYYLKGYSLVKGYSEARLKQLSQEVLRWMLMVFAVPTAILAEVAPKGPCNVEGNTPFSLSLSGDLKLQGKKVSRAVGQLSKSGPTEISYEMDVFVDPPAPDKASVRYSGTMQFAPVDESLSDDSDVAGYAMLGRSQPFSVVGSSAVPVATLGELRRHLKTRQSAPGAKPERGSRSDP